MIIIENQILYLSSAFSFLFNLLLGFFVFINNYKATVNKLFLLFIITLACWILGDFFYFIPILAFLKPIIWVKIANIGAILCIPIFMHFVYCFVEDHSKKKYIVLTLMYFISAIFLIFLFFTNYYIETVNFLIATQTIQIITGNFYDYFLFFFTVSLSYCYIFLIFKYFSTEKKIKEKIKYLFLATSMFFGAAIFYFPSVLGISRIRIDNLFFVFFFSIIAYAITKEDFFGITVIINRTVARIITALSVILIYSFSAYTFYQHNDGRITLSFIIFTLIFSIFVGEIYHWIRQSIQTGAVDKWLKDKYDPLILERTISKEFIPLTKREDILKTVAIKLRNTLQISKVNVFLYNPEKKHYESLRIDETSRHIIIPTHNSLIRLIKRKRGVVYNDTFSKLTRYSMPIIIAIKTFFGFMKDESADEFIKENNKDDNIPYWNIKAKLKRNLALSERLLKENEQKNKVFQSEDVLRFISERLQFNPNGIVFIPLMASSEQNLKSVVQGIVILDKRTCGITYTTEDFKIFKNIIAQTWLALDRIPYINALKIAKKEAEQANQFKTELLDMLSHELRTPFTQIIGGTKSIEQKVQVDMDKPLTEIIMQLTELNLNVESAKFEDKLEKVRSGIKILQDRATSIYQPAFENVIKSSNRLFEKIENILNVAALKANKSNLDLDYIQFDEIKSWLDEFLVSHADLYPHLTLVNTNINVALEKAFITDKNALFSILYNLLLNAFSFTREGNILVSLSLKNETVIISVQDTGIGIAIDEQTKIFEPLYQIETGLNRTVQGQGLGLYLVQEYAKLLHGQVVLKSEINLGSTFEIQLPYLNMQNVDPDLLIQDADFQNINLADVRLLVCDDDQANNTFVQMLLDDKLHLTTALNGAEAIKYLNEQPFDLVLMDIQMPVMDGVEALTEIRKFNQDVPIVAFTAQAMKGDRDRFLIKGFDEYYPKPIKGDTFLKFIQKMVYMKNKNLFQKCRILREKMYAKWTERKISEENVVKSIL